MLKFGLQEVFFFKQKICFVCLCVKCVDFFERSKKSKKEKLIDEYGAVCVSCDFLMSPLTLAITSIFHSCGMVLLSKKKHIAILVGSGKSNEKLEIDGIFCAFVKNIKNIKRIGTES